MNARGNSVWFKMVADGGGFAQFSLEIRNQNRTGTVGQLRQRRVRVGQWNNSRDGTDLGLTGYVDVITSVRSMAVPILFDEVYNDVNNLAIYGIGGHQ
jgi:hypothetical protein